MTSASTWFLLTSCTCTACHGRMPAAGASRGSMPATGARVGLCELPRDLVSSDERGGVGGTCVLRGCVPKKLMALGGLFREEWQDAAGFGCGVLLPYALQTGTSCH